MMQLFGCNRIPKELLITYKWSLLLAKIMVIKERLLRRTLLDILRLCCRLISTLAPVAFIGVTCDHAPSPKATASRPPTKSITTITGCNLA